MPSHATPHIQALHIQNYRVLKDLHLQDLTPLSVFIGTNGSGKSTLLEALTFLSDCFQNGLSPTCQKYGGLSAIKSYGQTSPLQFQITYHDPQRQCCMIYTLAIQSTDDQIYIEDETLNWIDDATQATQPLLAFTQGQGWAIPGEMSVHRHYLHNERQEEAFSTPDIIAAHTLSQFAKYPHLQTLRQFLSHWFMANLTHLSTQALPAAASPEYLSSTGDNLTNLIDTLQTHQPEQFQSIVQELTRQIPRLTDIQTIPINGRRRLHIKDNNATTALSADQASDGTLLLLAYLLLLQSSNPHHLVLIDEPENNLHPRLMTDLGEKFRAASAQQQILITTHSPHLVDTLRPTELWILHRESDGFTQACRASDIRGINAFIENGALLGQLWMENFLSLKDTLALPRSA
jgi:predicted ATPase